jgi:GTPase KRas protein
MTRDIPPAYPEGQGGGPCFHTGRLVVGNNCYKDYAREVSKEEGDVLARRYGCEFFKASAATAQNVELVFANLIRLLRQARIRNSVNPGHQPPFKRRRR